MAGSRRQFDVLGSSAKSRTVGTAVRLHMVVIEWLWYSYKAQLLVAFLRVVLATEAAQNCDIVALDWYDRHPWHDHVFGTSLYPLVPGGNNIPQREKFD